MLSLKKCSECPFFQQSSSLPSIGCCQFWGDRVRSNAPACNSAKTYTVTVCIEVSAQFEVEAGSIREAKLKAKKLAESSIDISFDGDCLNPDVDYLPIKNDAVEE